MAEPERTSAVRWLVGGSVVFTIITGLAAVDMALGNPTAINVTIMVLRD